MSLRWRITLVVATGVTAIVLILAAIVYASVRSHMRGQVDHTLVSRAQPFLQPHLRGGGPHGDDHRGGGGPLGPGDFIPGPPNQFGGATGYFQFVHTNGTVFGEGGHALLPVSARDVRIAKTGAGRYFTDHTVHGTHLRVLTIADPYDHTAVQVGLPLTDVDQVLHQLLLTFIGVIAAGIAAAALVGWLVGRGALRPIARFVRRTENVTGALDGSQRLEETGPSELARLAASFNRTLVALERSVQAQRHLVADASHELRTPIAALRSNIQIFLESGHLPVAEQQAMQASIIAELDELTQLVADVVELARGAEPAERAQPVQLDELVAEAVERARRRTPGLRFETRLEPTAIEHVPERVARAVTNVLDNARKWSPEGGLVEVMLSGGAVTVRDHGPGFDDADLPHVFERFYRARSARRMPGSGLGLAIVRQAAEARGGWVSAANAPDGGAVISVSFGPPLTVDAEPTDRKPEITSTR